MPILLRQESAFANLYGETGPPNWSVARMLGILILQEMLDEHDQAALDHLSFDSRWQYALDLTPEDAYLSRRSFVKFRSRLVRADPEMALLRGVFEAIGDAAIEQLGVSIAQQRIDSTHVTSNIRSRGRVFLFARTLELFLRHLLKTDASQMNFLPPGLRAWFDARVDAAGWGTSQTSTERTQLLQQLAEWLYAVKTLFENEAVSDDEPYQLVVRLLYEHCVLDDDDDDKPPGDGGAAGGGGVRIRRQGKGSGTSLQSPHDPDAGYSSHKGVGYSVQIVETCGNRLNEEHIPEILTDFSVHSAGIRDFGQTMPAVERLTASGRLPDVLYGDSHYTSGSTILACTARNVSLHSPAGRARLPMDLIGRDRFVFDDETGDLVACPQGHSPIGHVVRTTSVDRPQKRTAKLAQGNCTVCPLRGRCVARPPNSKKGHWHLDIEPDLRARDANLAAQATDEWRRQYRLRAGIEATNSELKRSHGMRHLRVRRRPRVTLAIAAKLTACNVKRWLRAR